MHPLRFLLIPLSLASVAFPRPLVITPVQPAPNAAQDPHLPDVPATGTAPPWVPAVQNTANGMLIKMLQVICNPTEANHKEIIDASFGPSDANKIEKIKDGIVKITNANVRLRIPPPNMPSPVHNSLRFSRPEGPRRNAPTVHNGWVTDSVTLAHDSGDSHVDTAAALIHRTAGYAAHANTRVELTPELKLKMLPLGASSPTALPIPIQYRSGNALTTPAQVNANRAWAPIRDLIVNAEQNSESYRVMAYLCDAHYRKRDLLEGDEEAYHSILRRNAGSCPPNKKNTVSPLTNGH